MLGALTCARAVEAIINSPHHVIEIPWNTRKENFRQLYTNKGFCHLYNSKIVKDETLPPTNSNKDLNAILAVMHIIFEPSITRNIEKLKPKGQRQRRKEILSRS